VAAERRFGTIVDRFAIARDSVLRLRGACAQAQLAAGT
jgi:hypothetical protein